MATQVSPGVRISEVDQTLALSQTALTEGGIAGYFQWGPIGIVRTVVSEDDLVKKYWKPDALSATYFFTAANFLAYSSVLRVARVVNQAQAKNATAAAGGAVIAGSTFTLANGNTVLTATTGNTSALYPGLTLSIANSTVGPFVVTVASVANANAAILTTAASGAVTSGTAQTFGELVRSEEHYDASFADGTATTKGEWAAKYAGALGNSIRIEVCHGSTAYASSPSVTLTTANVTTTTVNTSASIANDLQVGDIITANGESRQVTALLTNTAFTINSAFSTALTTAAFTRKWQYAGLFSGAPSTSPFAAARGAANDEMHVVVVDAGGAFTGLANTVLEKYEFVSKAQDAKVENGATNYYKEVINRRSAYVWWFDHNASGTNYGSDVTGVTFGAPTVVESTRLRGGVNGTAPTDADIITGYNLFLDDLVDVSFLLGANASPTVASHIISNIVEKKSYMMAFFSPRRADVVENVGSEVADIIEFRNLLPSTSYAVLDSGWMYRYDKYNDTYRYVPCNGDTAGCCVRGDQQAEPWFSPAGFNRGQIKNVIKLAFNPNEAARDDLYRSGVNPIVTFPGQGTVLFGDKTLLSRPSAFDRINVRRLFNILEKTVERSAKQQLFEQNDEFTRQAFVNLVEPYLRSVKGRRGITDYFVVCDSTNNPADAIDRNEFRADIFVKPVRSINFIQLNFIAVRSDVQFNEIISNIG